MMNTKIHLLTLFALLLIGSISNAYNVPKIHDTTKTQHILDELATRPPQESEYKINKNSFYIKYGFDYTAKRIIDNHFYQKNTYIFFIISPVIAYMLLILSFIFLAASFGVAGAGFLVFSILTYIIAWILRIIGIIKLSQHRGIDLLYELIYYKKTGDTPFGQKPIPSTTQNKDYYESK